MARLREFERCTVEYGGRPSRGMRIKCGKCGAADTMHIASIGGFSADNQDKGTKIGIRKFEDLGWTVGATAAKDRCPTCTQAIVKASPFRILQGGVGQGQQKKGDVMKATIISPPDQPAAEPPAAEPPAAEPPAAEPPAADPLRELTRDSRRIIFAKLEETYVDERTGYRAPWTDHTVARDLGVPQAWVAKIREENFGSLAANPAVDAAIVDAQKLLDEAKAELARFDKIGSDLQHRIERTEKALFELRKGLKA